MTLTERPIDHSMFERRVHALVAGSALVAIAAALTVVVGLDPTDSVLQAGDDEWLGWMAAARTPWLTDVAEIMSILGGPFVMVPLRLAIIGALAWRRRWLQFVAFVGATITSELCIGPLKALIDRPRPPGALIATDSASFPSGHAVAASVTAIGLVIVLVPAASRRGRWTIAAVAFAATMAMSRTYLAAHWASDVIAGVCIGTGLAVAWPAALDLLRARRCSAPREPSSAPRRTASALRIVSMVLLSVGLACVMALHLLRPDLEPTRHRLSEYALGPYGSVMTIAFVTIGAGLLTLAWPLAAARGRWSRAVPIAIAVAGAGMIIAGIYRTDPGRSGPAVDTMHSRASAVATVALIGAALAWSVLGDAARRRQRPDFGLAIAAAVLGVLSPVLHRSSWTGVSQRLLWLALLAWLIVTAWRVAPTRREAMRPLTSPPIEASATPQLDASPSDT